MLIDPENCRDQKDAGGTFDMFDAKLGNCLFYLGAWPHALDGTAESPSGCPTAAVPAARQRPYNLPAVWRTPVERQRSY